MTRNALLVLHDTLVLHDEQVHQHALEYHELAFRCDVQNDVQELMLHNEVYRCGSFDVSCDGLVLAHDGLALVHDGLALVYDGLALFHDGMALVSDGMGQFRGVLVLLNGMGMVRLFHVLLGLHHDDSQHVQL